jgi:hypothetical protein
VIRRWWATVVCGVVAGALVTTFAVQYRRAGDRLAREERTSAAVEAELAAQRSELVQTLAAAGLHERAITATRSAVADAVGARTWAEALTRATEDEVATTQAAIKEAETARYLVAANAAEARGCFDGVSRAVAANRGADRRGAVTALQGANGACTHTLALATGARFPYDFPDPFVLRAGGTYYAYSTNSGAGDVQVIRSADLVTWELVGNALPVLARWARPGTTWAPSVLARPGGYVLYYTTRHDASNRQCISRAVAASPAGPFLDDSSAPIVCDPGGSLDPSPFVDTDGRAFLLWKSEGFPPGGQTHLWSQQLSADGRSTVGTPARLISADRSFERGIVEGPSLLREGGRYFLVYSAANWTAQTYSIAYATCAGPSGPCTKPGENRVLRSGARLAGPGGAEVFRDAGGGLWVGFHAFSEPHVGYPSSRYFHIAPLRVNGDTIAIDAST